jgi:hypothetical protein
LSSRCWAAAAADLQFLDAWSKAAGQVFDERDCGRV